MTTIPSEWDALADAELLHDPARAQHAWRLLMCTTCNRETRLPGEHQCADCFIASAHRRKQQERAA